MSDALRLVDHPLVSTLGWALLHFVWQGALIGLAAFVLLRLVRPRQASVRYLVGVTTLAAMLIAPVATFLSLADEPASRGATAVWQPASVSPAGVVTGSMTTDIAANPATTRRLIPPSSRTPRSADGLPIATLWLPIVSAAWMLGVTSLSMRLVGGWMVTRRLACRAVVAVSPSVEAAARAIGRRLALQRGVAILESAAVSVPTLVGWVRPVVLLPAAALSGLSPLQLQAILAHELAHVRRHDYLINLLQSVVETLLFYHPAVWWVSSEVRAERENCCDDLAVAVCGDRLIYVSALAELTSIDRQRLSLAATDGSLVTRVRRILGQVPQGRRELPPTWGILVLLALLGGGGTYELTTSAADAAPVPQAVTAEQAPKLVAEHRANQITARLQKTAELRARLEEAKLTIAEIESTRNADQARELAKTRLAELVQKKRALELAIRARKHELQELAKAQDAAILSLTEINAAQSRDWFEPVIAPVAPVAPVAPTAPVAPVAPVAPDQVPPAGPVGVSVTRGEGSFSWSHNGDRRNVKWTGPFRLSDDERDIVWIEEGARVTISDGWIFTDRIQLRGLGGDKIERNFYRSGLKRDYDADGRPFLVNALARMIRSGMFASDRVARLLKRGGPEAVLAEIDRLQTDSSYVKRVYYSALLKQAEITPPVLARVLERVNRDITLDYEKATLLVQILQEGPLAEDQRIAVARTVRNISSDYEQRKVLAALLATEPLSPGLAAAAIDAAESIGSSHDRSIVLLELARKGGVTAETSTRFMAAVSSMPSAFEQRKVLAALAGAAVLPEHVAIEGLKAAGSIDNAYDKRQAIAAYVARRDGSPRVATVALGSAATITSAHDKAEVLLEVVSSGGLTDETASAFFSAATTITSSHDLSRVLKAVAARPRLSDTLLTGVLRAAGSISSSHDRASVLLDVLKAQPLSPAARLLLLDVAQGISSSHDQNRVLAELVRAERR